MSYTQQEIVKLYKQLIPSIKESNGQIKIALRGKEFTIEQGRSPSQKITSRNLQYR